MNVLLADHTHRVIKIPANSIKSIIGVEHGKLPDDKAGAKAVLRYNYGAGPMFAWLRTSAGAVMKQIADRSIGAPTAWVPLATPEGDEIYLPAASMIAVHGLDPAECGGANSRVDFDAFGDGREIKFARVIEDADEIEAAREAVEQSVADALKPAPPPATTAKPTRKPRALRK